VPDKDVPGERVPLVEIVPLCVVLSEALLETVRLPLVEVLSDTVPLTVQDPNKDGDTEADPLRVAVTQTLVEIEGLTLREPVGVCETLPDWV